MHLVTNNEANSFRVTICMENQILNHELSADQEVVGHLSRKSVY